MERAGSWCMVVLLMSSCMGGEGADTSSPGGSDASAASSSSGASAGGSSSGGGNSASSGASSSSTGSSSAAASTSGGGADGGCQPDPQCRADCNPCTGSCTRGTWSTTACVCDPVAGTDVLELSPARRDVLVGQATTFTATLTAADCSTRDVTLQSSWQSDNPSVARVTGLGEVESVTVGEAHIRATYGTTVSNAATVSVTSMALTELRGVWITRFGYSSRATLEAIIDDAAAAGFNAVFVQIRGNGDAYYRSTLEPWARGLSGTLGRDPGWDPLQVALDRAHMHGMEMHAYFNALTAWVASGALPVAEGTIPHALETHPEWMAVTSAGVNEDSEYRWFTPGNPAVRTHTAAVAEDLLTRYAVDGLHLDRIRSPARTYSHDTVTQAAYDAARATNTALTWDEFMREQVNLVVEGIHGAVQRARPQARLSASVWGIYMPLSGCNTSAGLRDYHQDSRAWMQRGIMDALVPMIYWPISQGACTNWSALLDGFMSNRANRHIWAGMHALEPGNTFDFTGINARIEYARAVSAHGTVVFASSYLDDDPARWQAYVGTSGAPGPFAEAADVPPMPWKMP